MTCKRHLSVSFVDQIKHRLLLGRSGCQIKSGLMLDNNLNQHFKRKYLPILNGVVKCGKTLQVSAVQVCPHFHKISDQLIQT